MLRSSNSFIDWDRDRWWDRDCWLALAVSTDQGNRCRANSVQGKSFQYDKKFVKLEYERCRIEMAAGVLDGDGK
jgi:hypothetical protein